MEKIKLTIAHCEQWLDSLTKAWVSRDVEAAAKLFEACEEYVETPFGPTARDTSGVRAIWEEVKRQSDIDVSVSILSASGLQCIANYRARYVDGDRRHESDGIYVIDFHSNGTCRRFRLWSMSKD